MSKIPEDMPYDEEFMFFGVKAKDMTRTELLQVIKHLSGDAVYYRQRAQESSNQLADELKSRSTRPTKRFIII